MASMMSIGPRRMRVAGFYTTGVVGPARGSAVILLLARTHVRAVAQQNRNRAEVAVPCGAVQRRVSGGGIDGCSGIVTDVDQRAVAEKRFHHFAGAAFTGSNNQPAPAAPGLKRVGVAEQQACERRQPPDRAPRRRKSQLGPGIDKGSTPYPMRPGAAGKGRAA